MAIIHTLLFFLAGSPFSSNASPHGNANETILQNKKDAQITCNEGFVIDGTLTKCLRVATGFEDTCEESKQCSEFLSVGGICQGGKCLCLSGYHYLHGECHKSKGLFESCEEDADCFVDAEYHAVACIEKVCKCRDGFYQREYSTCRRKAKGINDECLINSDCSFSEDAICVNKNCTLSEEANFVKAEDYNRNIEREETTTAEPIVSTPPSIQVGHGCNVNKDCEFLPNSYCGFDKKCTCNRAHFAWDNLTTCIPEIGEKCTDKDELHVKGAVCKDGRWTCPIDYAALKNNRVCKLVSGFNEKCTRSEQCQLLGPQAICEEKSCQCNSTSRWLESETFCWITKKLEEECESNNDCFAIGNSITPICQKKDNKKICSCPAKSHMSKSSGYKVCIADQTELGSYCAENSDCKIANSTCQSNKCQCANNYFTSGKICLAGLNAVCEENADCKLNNTVCLKRKDGAACQCADNFVATPERQCITKSAFNATCSCNLQCSSVTANAICMTNVTSLREDVCGSSNTGKCQCKEEDYYRDGACFKKKRLGEECTKQSECFTKGEQHAVCRNGVCSCNFEYMSDGDYCVPVNYSNSIKMSLWSMILLAALV